MSASFSDVAASNRRAALLGAWLLMQMLMLAGTSGCVTRAQDAASQSDISWFARTLRPDSPLSDLDPDEFESVARTAVETPIEFHGRVLSDAGNPLKGAKVTAAIFDHLVDPFEFPFFAFTKRPPVLTDDEGRFRFVGERGAGMYVTIEVPGWEPVITARRLYVYAEDLNAPSDLPFDPASSEQFVFSPRPPEAELQPIHTGALPLVADGEPLEVALRAVAPYGVEPGTGDAIITCNRTLADAAPHARFDWWCELEIPGGGLQPRRLTTERAPEAGYEESGRLAFQADDPDWDDRAERDLIVRFADGNYAFVRVSMRMDGDFYVAFDGFWNPTGSLWLD